MAIFHTHMGLMPEVPLYLYTRNTTVAHVQTKCLGIMRQGKYMRFPVSRLLDDQESLRWLEGHFHPEGLKCLRCGSDKARYFRTTETSCLKV